VEGWGREGDIPFARRHVFVNGHFRVKRSPKVNILSSCGFHEKLKLTAVLSINALPIKASLECLEGLRLLCVVGAVRAWLRASRLAPHL
jgi:hypothetical protein